MENNIEVLTLLSISMKVEGSRGASLLPCIRTRIKWGAVTGPDQWRNSPQNIIHTAHKLEQDREGRKRLNGEEKERREARVMEREREREREPETETETWGKE
jgi:hypothetical protein